APPAPGLVVLSRRDVDEALGLPLDRLDDVGMRVPGRAHCDPRRPVDEAIAVHVPDLGALAPVHDEGVVARIGGRDHGGIALEDRARNGTRHVQFRDGHAPRLHPVVRYRMLRMMGISRSRTPHPVTFLALLALSVAAAVS